ncbi:MAG: amidase [Balneolaceae bacterium]|nr:amidase [Balneolaceae bacterium]MCH8548819.1 N-acetylmuramoyl-L-alanine amidase [Balneolaceae bacterium]
MAIKDEILTGEGCRFDEAGKNGGEFEAGLPDTIVIHYTAGPSVASAINTFRDPAVESSAHLLVDFDGSVAQLIPFSNIAWHCGRSSWLDLNGINRYSIGIEVVNAGPLEKSGNLWYAWYGRSYKREEVVRAIHRNEDKRTYWHRFTEEQIDSVMNICKVLTKKYKIRYILDHEEISPGRKRDPGPAFPLEKIRERVLVSDRSGRNHEEGLNEKAFVSAPSLNVRSGPGTNFDIISQPLSRRTEVLITDRENGWAHVEFTVTGWVSENYIHK